MKADERFGPFIMRESRVKLIERKATRGKAKLQEAVSGYVKKKIESLASGVLTNKRTSPNKSQGSRDSVKSVKEQRELIE